MKNYKQRTEHFRDSMAAILNKCVEFPIGCLVTVVDAKLTSDLQFANTELSVMPISAEEGVKKALKMYHREIMDEMAKTLNLRRLPKLHWSFSTVEHQASELESYMNELKEQGELD